MSGCLAVWLSVCLSGWLAGYLSVYMSVCMYVRLSVCMSVLVKQIMTYFQECSGSICLAHGQESCQCAPTTSGDYKDEKLCQVCCVDPADGACKYVYSIGHPVRTSTHGQTLQVLAMCLVPHFYLHDGHANSILILFGYGSSELKF
jgi:hypothetical protein